MDTAEVYREASIATGKTTGELHAMAHSVFASMLYHAMKNCGAVWTVSRIVSGQLNIEVNVSPKSTSSSSEGGPSCP